MNDSKCLQRSCRARAFARALCLMSLWLAAGAVTAQEDLTVRAITSSEGSLNTNFALISGADEAVLVDVPFLRSDAYRLVADVLDSGKRLTKIIVTHAHPDHFFGLDVFKDAFPDVEVIAHPEVAADFWVAFPARYGYWAPLIGANAPRHPVIPAPFGEGSFELEGHRIEILGPMTGDTPIATAVWVPSTRALITGDIAFDQVHVYAADHDSEGRAAWIASLDRLLELDPEMVVAGHTRGNPPHTRASLEYTRDYLLRFEAAMEEADSADAFMAIMRDAFPEAMDFVGDFILTTSADAAMAEKAGR